MKNLIISERRRGLVKVSIGYLEHNSLAVLQKTFFKYMLIYDVEIITEGDYYEYLAWSPLFDKLEEGESAPQYEIVITKKYLKNRTKYTVKAVRL